MRNPFRIDGPAVVSFSGGRTSGLMLCRILEAHGGTLPADVKVVFCNTGKEREETLEFVERCSQQWGVPVVWLEYRYEPGDPEGRHTFAVVDFATASRAGEPFEAIVHARKCLPNFRARFCTSELKLRTNMRYLRSLGWTEWDNAIGLRHDEPQRVAKIRGRQEVKAETVTLPLDAAGVTLADVTAFWAAQPFDLALSPEEGNCDLCFLKGPNKVRRLIRDRPESADWWARMETLIPSPTYGTLRFRNDRPSYAALKDHMTRPGLFPLESLDEPDELAIACHCTD
jgi:3'-phosphoadenosine 5'-phosphosulfate sulfotransferase (PAPS reductase)/FAD synthetase